MKSVRLESKERERERETSRVLFLGGSLMISTFFSPFFVRSKIFIKEGILEKGQIQSFFAFCHIS